MKALVALLLLPACASMPVEAKQKEDKPIVVAVIDTGISEEAFNANYLCKMGHRDFTGTGLKDTHGHGTHISTTIDQYVRDIHPSTIYDGEFAAKLASAKKTNYCQVILKYYDPKMVGSGYAIDYLSKAFRYAINIKVDVINYSGGGTAPFPSEEALIKEALDNGIKVVVAAGNEYSELYEPEPSPTPTPTPTPDKAKVKVKTKLKHKKDGKPHTYYPAQYDSRLVVVGNLRFTDSGVERAPSSNWGKQVTEWEIGTNVLSLDANWIVVPMTGTSQATAVRTGKIVHQMLFSH